MGKLLCKTISDWFFCIPIANEINFNGKYRQFLLILAKEIPERIFFFKMADIVQAEVWAAKTKAFLPIQALISRVLKRRKFKYDEGVSLEMF